MNGFPYRKSLRLKGFDYSQDGCFFVTICTYQRQTLFDNPVGAPLCGRPFTDAHPNNIDHSTHICTPTPVEMVKKWLLELNGKFSDVSLCEYVIMPDHVHFIIAKYCKNGVVSGDHTGSPLRYVVGWFKTMTTNNYIRNVKNNIYPPFNKKIWQRGYYEHIIRNEYDYAETAKYILNNPLSFEINNQLIGEYHL